jgi:hypothetical protein
MSDFDLNKALRAISSRVTDDQREEQAKLNARGRAMLAVNSMEYRVSLAQAQEQAVLEQINLLEALPDSQLKNDRISVALDRLSELYAEQGRYEEAIEVTPNEARREQFRLTLQAIDRTDGQTCNCPPEQFIDRKNNSNFKQSTMQNLGQVVSREHGRLVRLKVCRKCGFAEAS